MMLHSILHQKTNHWLRLKPRPDYSGMDILQRIRAKCADAKRELERKPCKYHCTIQYAPEQEIGRSRVDHSGWIALELKGGTG